MTPEEAAAELDGNQYREEGSLELFKRMKEAGLVAVFGASDDLMEFRGAIYDELSACEGCTAYLDERGLFQSECGNGEDCPYFQRQREGARTIEAIWCPSENPDPEDDSTPFVSWAYKTDIPHALFAVMEEDETYCHGIVFRLADAARK